jgi:catechol 2,3-dioxygenase-like lactoylglutathione lyase family enzyme
MLASSKLQTIVLSSRMADAENFYGGVLGLPLKGRSHGALVYDVGGADLRVSPVPSTQPSAHTVLGFAVPDLRMITAALSVRGVAWERFPGFPQDADGVLVTPDGSRVVWFRDPDGNLLSIVQYG